MAIQFHIYVSRQKKTNSTVKLSKTGSASEITLQYRINNNKWKDYTIGDSITLSNIGDYVEFYGENDHFSSDSSSYYKFLMTGKVAAKGSIMSLMGFSDSCTDYCFYNLFSGCTSLETAPELPATTLADYCYYQMFANCTSLTTAPVLPATTLADECYYEMFYGCTSLTTAPELPATTLASNCYAYMFQHCTSLVTAPLLPASILADSCYFHMFYKCTSLSSIEVNFIEWNPSNATSSWVNGVNSGGSFKCPSSLPTTYRGPNNIPKNWLITTK